MNWDGDLPHNAYELAGLVIVGLVVMILAQIAGGAWLFRFHKNNAKALRSDTAEIKGQVVNGHTEGLRDAQDRYAADAARAINRVEAKVDMMAGKFDRVEANVERLAVKVDRLDEKLATEKNSRFEMGRELRDEVSEIRDNLRNRRHRDPA